MSFKSIVNRRQWTKTDHKRSPCHYVTSELKTCDVAVRTRIMNFFPELLHGVNSTMCKQRKQCIMQTCQSNIASKTATGLQGYTMTKNKHLTSLKAVELRLLVHYVIYRI